MSLSSGFVFVVFDVVVATSCREWGSAQTAEGGGG